jgi:NDP-sugar pyrophosphorylase family protein
MSHSDFDSVIPYINAGGRGTRLEGVVESSPRLGVAKALIEVGRPALRLIDHHLNRLHDQGFSRTIVHVGDQMSVKNYLEGRYHTDSLTVVYTPVQLGTGGDLLQTVREGALRGSSTVFSQNVDTILDIDTAAFLSKHRVAGKSAAIALTTRQGVPNQDSFMVATDEQVLWSRELTSSVRRKPRPHQIAYVASSTGALLLEADFLEEFRWQPTDGSISVGNEVLAKALDSNGLTSFNNGERYFQDVGTPEPYLAAQRADGPTQPYLAY